MIAAGVFATACLWLVALIGDWGTEGSPPIGGGSYNLDRLVYSALILLLAGSSSFCSLVVGLARQDRALSRRAFVFSGIAMVAFLASYSTFGHNLS
ncbi:hypothetical protein [Sphingomonas psychrotolerans]|uniref:Uncharacterized protein n=1 Tax=Sphingomonas psychrotolerans TaxID=1327635 RepID=A0A2K8MHE8_9SPHN|nr:hypothetical protein [Sphingomonas psychrotolerans]ATY31179.1 hypothetical protein CVN68_03600 [Sphingomonas psychrotolerans]